MTKLALLVLICVLAYLAAVRLSMRMLGNATPDEMAEPWGDL